jgi:molybdopterin/thiamine biosynthesis adenylyltransferase
MVAQVTQQIAGNTDHLYRPQVADGMCVRLVGLGGVGGIIARYGAMFVASLGVSCRMLLIDGDAFEPGNATRMFFSGHGNKAAVTRADLLSRFADSPLTLIAIEEYLTPDNIARLLGGGSPSEIILLAVDNHATRKLVSDYCQTLNDICLISGGNDGIGEDSSGQVRRGTFASCQAYIRRGGADLSPSLTKFHPEINNPADTLPTEKSCTELVASVPQILFANLATASAMLNTMWLYLCGELHYPELCVDIAVGQMAPIPLPMDHKPIGVASSGKSRA